MDIFQPCVSFNKINTYKWYKENTYYLDDSHDTANKTEAFKRAMENDKYPLGIFYLNESSVSFEDNLAVYKDNKNPLFTRISNPGKLQKLVEIFQ